MAVSLTLNPLYPIPGHDCKVTFGTAAATNLVRIYCTDAPEGSPQRSTLDSTNVTQILLYEGPSVDIWTFRPEKAGVYQLSCEEYTQGASTHGGAYKDDPEGYPSETKLGSNTTTISVSSKVTAQIGAGSDNATLVLYVNGTTIRQTFAGVHGENTPRLEEPSSDKAKTATRSAAVVSALAALVDVTMVTALGTPSDIADDLIVKFNAHRTQSGVHAANDTTNTISVSYRVPGSPAGVARSANEILLKLSRHMQNDDNGAGVGTASYHSPAGNDRADLANALIVSAANEQDALGQCLLLVDLVRAYELHRSSTIYHDTADSTNAAAALPVLLYVYGVFLLALQASSPTPPVTANSGAVLAVHSGGFQEA